MEHPGLGSWLRKRRLKTPDKTALIHGDGVSMTYAQLADFTDGVTRMLSARGVGKGDRVAYLGENTPEFVAALFGCAQLGAVFVPVNTRLARPEILHVLADCRARVLIHDPEFAEKVAPVLSAVGIAHVLETGDLAAPSRTDSSADGGSAGRLDADAAPEDPAAIVYTSGSTGRAKGAVLTHRNLTWVAVNNLVDYDIVSTDVALMISPLFHVASLGMGTLPVILKGGTIVLAKRFEPGEALRLIARHGVTMVSGVPTTYQLMADHPDWSQTDLSTLTTLTCGGSAVPTRILNAYEERGLRFSQGYGLTETSPGATSLAPGMTTAKQGSVGLPHFFTDVRIAGEDGSAAPRGTVGEIEITGPNVFPGYLDLAEATADAFTPDGWFRSGDLGYLDDDGYLYISDRLKDMIISGGENIYPAEVENLINDIEGVTGVAVIGVSDDRWGEVPWAVLTVGEAASVSTESVRAHLDGKLARYKLPREVVIVEALPRTASGKIQKNELRKRFAR